MSRPKYDPGMVERKRKPRNVTLNPVLVEELQAIGKEQGEERLSVLLDEAMRQFIRNHRASNPKSAPRRRS